MPKQVCEIEMKNPKSGARIQRLVNGFNRNKINSLRWFAEWFIYHK